MSKTHHAYPNRSDLEVIMRMSAVKRWHMIDTTRIQNLAEHTANVALLGWLVAHKCPQNFFSSSEVMLHSMIHDLGESFLGDIPTHSKILIGKELVKVAETSVLPTAFRVPESETKTKDLIKLCDLADGIRFIRLHGVDLTAKHAQTGLEDQYHVKWQKAYSDWPHIVYQFVFQQLQFYAYESD